MLSWDTLKTLTSRKTDKNLPLPASGVFHYQRSDEHGKVRLHLRLEADGYGLLLVNASRVFHLNPTAAYLAFLSLEGVLPQAAVSALVARFRVSRTQAQADYEQFMPRFLSLIDPQGPCPVCELEMETTAPFSARPSAPYRMDLALTYRCNNGCSHCYNDRSRNQQELGTDQWKQILDHLWNIGIPHIVFTGGEPTLREDLVELIAYAEQKGMISGINTNGRMLKDASYVEKLVSAGLDHAQITIESHDAEIHDGMVNARGAWDDTVAGLRNLLSSGLFVMTNTTLLKDNSPFLAQTLNFFGELGVPTVGLNALIHSGRGLAVRSGLPEADLAPLLSIAHRLTDKYEQRLIWYTPTQYCHFNPLDMNLGVKGCTAALYNMCIEPDGSVIPCQSYYQSLGNILEVPWNSIWNHDLAIRLRERSDVPFACLTCSLLSECGGGCPLARQVPGGQNPLPVYSLPFAGTEVIS